jgi:hypothetical protein
MIGGRREYMARFIGGVIRSTVQGRPLPNSNWATEGRSGPYLISLNHSAPLVAAPPRATAAPSTMF